MSWLAVLMPSPNTSRKRCKVLLLVSNSEHTLRLFCIPHASCVQSLLNLSPHTPHTHTHTSTALRVSRSARPSSLDGGPKSAAPVTVGKKGKDFEFSDLSLKVQFVECSARGKGTEGESVADITEILAWLNKQC